MKKIVSVFNRVFVVLPFLLATVLALVYMTGGWENIFPNLSLAHFRLGELTHWGGVYLIDPSDCFIHLRPYVALLSSP